MTISKRVAVHTFPQASNPYLTGMGMAVTPASKQSISPLAAFNSPLQSTAHLDSGGRSAAVFSTQSSSLENRTPPSRLEISLFGCIRMHLFT